jgi:hypothetical protein
MMAGEFPAAASAICVPPWPEIALARNDVTIRERQIANEVRQACATLHREKAIDVHAAASTCCGRWQTQRRQNATGHIAAGTQTCLGAVEHHGGIDVRRTGEPGSNLNILRNRPLDIPSDRWPRGRTAAPDGLGDLQRLAIDPAGAASAAPGRAGGSRLVSARRSKPVSR